MSKRIIETTIWIARTAEWHITMDRHARDYAAIIDAIGCIGIFATEAEARKAIRDYTFETLKAA